MCPSQCSPSHIQSIALSMVNCSAKIDLSEILSGIDTAQMTRDFQAILTYRKGIINRDIVGKKRKRNPNSKLHFSMHAYSCHDTSVWGVFRSLSLLAYVGYSVITSENEIV